VRRRGWILIVGAVLLMAAVTASLTPAPREGDDGGEAPPATTQPAPGTAPGEARELRMDAARPATEEVARGTHVVLEVSVPRPGQVAIPRLGLTGFAHPGTPAVFDVLAERTGRYDVTLAPTGGEPRRAGTLVVR
jgi:hypothetical protein